MRLAALLAFFICGNAWSHSASDAYLTLTAQAQATAAQSVVHGQWDIALRDLDFVLKLDQNGDGQISWGEVRRQQQAVERYAYRALTIVDDAGKSCTLKPTQYLVDRHADGAYAALFFDILCVAAPKSLSLKYSLFFGIDPSHRGIFVFKSGDAASTALLSPQNSSIPLKLTR
jgi:hypothetical protein